MSMEPEVLFDRPAAGLDLRAGVSFIKLTGLPSEQTGAS